MVTQKNVPSTITHSMTSSSLLSIVRKPSPLAMVLPSLAASVVGGSAGVSLGPSPPSLP